jgi:hypothetical protein
LTGFGCFARRSRRVEGSELYENGVSRRLVLDYNDFVIAGVKDAKPCK